MQLELTSEEQTLLTRLLETALADARVEIRRTTTPEFHDRLAREEAQLAALLQRLGGGQSR